MYRGFEDAARYSRELGFRVNLITNGLLLTQRRLEQLADVVSVIGISLDGVPARHDELRGMSGAFSKIEPKIAMVRDLGIPFGFAHCVTSSSIADLPWLLEYAIDQHASLLQLHPLAQTGRATKSERLALSQADMARLYLVAQLLRIQANGQILLQLDAAPASAIETNRHLYRAMVADPPIGQLADWVNPLVMDERGLLWPLAYGMSANQCITPEQGEWFSTLERYKRSGAPSLKRLLHAAYSRLTKLEGKIIDWYAMLTLESYNLNSDLDAAFSNNLVQLR